MSALLALRARIRFALWVLRLRIELRRRGGRLVLEGRARFDGPPRLKIVVEGEGDHTLTLRFAEGVRLGRDLHLEVWAAGTSELDLGEGVYFQHACRIQLRGGRIVLGPHTHVRDGAVLRSRGELVVAGHVTVGMHDMLAAHERVVIAECVGLGERVSVTDVDHVHDGTLTPWAVQGLVVEPVEIGPNVLVGAGAVILRGARIGAGAVIGANALLLRGEHAAGTLHGGSPARPLKPL